MSWPSKIYVATKTLGVYYTSNFHDPSTQPTWVAVNGGLPATDVRLFALDPFEPEARQYLLLETARTLYRRVNGGDWEAILTSAEVRTLVSETADGSIKSFCLDESVQGRIWVAYEGHNASGDTNTVQALYSDDYGDTWETTTLVAAGWASERTAHNAQAYGDTVFICWNSGAGYNISYSTNKGASWSSTNLYSAGPSWIVLNPLQPDRVYYYASSNGNLYSFTSSGVNTALSATGVYSHNLWFAPDDSLHHRLATSNKIYVTTDGWTTNNSPSTVSPNLSEISAWAGSDINNIIVGLVLSTAPTPQNHVIGVLYEEDDTTATGIAGANCGSSPYTDSIPKTCGGVAIDGVQAVKSMPTVGPTPPPDSTITPPGGSPITLGGTASTQAVTMPGYTGSRRGEPLPGDRGAWAVDTAAHAALHASDIADSAPVYHNPTGATTGDAPIWDGSKWTPADVLTPAEHTAIGNGSPHHAPVTLGDANLDLLALDGQELTLSSPFTGNGDLLTSSGAGLVIGDTDIAPTGTADANSYASAEFAPSKANDSNENTRWGCSSGTNVNSWIRITFSSAKTIGAFRLNKYVNEDCSNWKIQAWVDGAWLDIYSGTALGDTGKVNLASPQTSTQFRALFVSGLTHANYMSVWTFGLYEATYVFGDLTIIPIGTVGQVLMAGDSIPEWGDLPEPETLPDHDHSGDAGDGGQFDAANLSSGAATDGQVLTADGAGGAAWEDAAAGGGAYAETIGNGTDLDFDIVHNLGTTDVVVQIYDLDLYEPDILAEASVTVIDANTVNVAFESIPAADQYRVVILAAGGSGGGSGIDENAIHDNEAGEIHAITEKTSLADNDEFLIEDSADSYNKKRVKKSNIGGGAAASDIIKTDTYANIPAAGTAGRIFLPSDGLYLYRDSGSAWTPWGPIFPMTPPVSGDFSWVNQGASSIDTTYGGIYLLAPANSSDNFRLLVKSQPTIPYTITTALIAHLYNVNYAVVGIGWRDSSSGKLVMYMIAGEGEGTLRVSKYNSPTSYNSNYTNIRFGAYNTLCWMRIADDGTNRICSWSLDGRHWHTLHSISRTDFMTADQVCFGASSINSTYPCGMTLLSWKEE